MQFSKKPIMANFGELPRGEIPEPLKFNRDFGKNQQTAKKTRNIQNDVISKEDPPNKSFLIRSKCLRIRFSYRDDHLV